MGSGCTSAPSALYFSCVSLAAQKTLNSVVQRSWINWMGVASNHSKRSRPCRYFGFVSVILNAIRAPVPEGGALLPELPA